MDKSLEIALRCRKIEELYQKARTLREEHAAKKEWFEVCALTPWISGVSNQLGTLIEQAPSCLITYDEKINFLYPKSEADINIQAHKSLKL